jgi:hypothetical protein
VHRAGHGGDGRGGACRVDAAGAAATTASQKCGADLRASHKAAPVLHTAAMAAGWRRGGPRQTRAHTQTRGTRASGDKREDSASGDVFSDVIVATTAVTGDD